VKGQDIHKLSNLWKSDGGPPQAASESVAGDENSAFVLLRDPPDRSTFVATDDL
jgi:hypothetical protein